MITDLDIWRSAKLLVDQHGEDARAKAAARAKEMLQSADLDGRRTWLRIIEAVTALLDEHGDGEPSH